MGNSISDYTFAIIKDEPVPLAGSFDSFSYMPVIMAVLAAVVVVALILYSVWVYTKSTRYALYSGMTTGNVVKRFFIHPIMLDEAGRELDHRVLNQNAV